MPEPVLPVPGVPGSVTLGLVPGLSLMPEPVLPVPAVPGSVTLDPVPGRLLMPEPLLPVPGVPGLGALGLVPGLSLMPEPLLPAPGVPEPLIPEPLLPVPLLPEPEVCASTNGAVTTSTARAVTTVLLHLLNIALFSFNLYGCACLVAVYEPSSPALPQRGTHACRSPSPSSLTQRHTFP
jgi:hypothetical protein